jgi:aminopeptidase N
MTPHAVHAVAIALIMTIAPPPASADDGQVRSVQLALTIQLDPAKRTLNARAELNCECSGAVTLSLGKRFTAERIAVDGSPAAFEYKATDEQQQWRLQLPKQIARHRIELRYRGELAPLAQADERGVLGGLPPMASERGTFLPGGSGWYPELAVDTFAYRVDLELPVGQRGLVAGRLVSESSSETAYRARFELEHPIEGIDLVAGPYRVEQRALTLQQSHEIALRTLFHPEIADLASGYLDAAAGYVERYSKAIGRYPYAGFSVVSSPLPTGFGMASFTYIGVEVLRLPFIRATSLGHEVLHNWWGNGVYVDWQRGNWCEGLTTFMADYAFKEDEGEAAAQELRLTWLRDFAALPAERDQPLRAFTSRTHDASQIVGYDKAAFLFLMLRDEILQHAFDAGIRHIWTRQQFRRASWADLEAAFEESSGRDLSGFFSQWLDRRGAPVLAFAQASWQQSGSRYRVRATLTQGEPLYRLRVPISVETDHGTEPQIVHLDAMRQELSFETQGRPRTMTIDPTLRVFRRLDAREIPPILRQVTLDRATVTVLATKSDDVQQAGQALAQRLMDTAPRFDESLPHDASVVVIGLHSDVDAWLTRANLPPEPQQLRNRGSAQVWTAQLTNGRTLLAISARDAASLQALLRPLPHYGRQSWLVFDGAKAVDRGVWAVQAVSWRFE